METGRDITNHSAQRIEYSPANIFARYVSVSSFCEEKLQPGIV